jgi:hypothetical protein
MKGKGGNGRSSMLLMGRGTMVLVVSMVMMFAVISAIAQDEAEVTVTVNAPEYVEEGETFDVTIEVDSVTDFNSARFDLSFDPSVVEVTDVTDGCLGDTVIPIYYKGLIDYGTIKKVTSGFPEEVDTKVSGTGSLAKITFEVIGEEDDECALEISGELVKIGKTDTGMDGAEEIPVEWIDAEIRIGVEEGGEEEEEEEGDEPTPTPSTSPTPIGGTNVTNVTDVTNVTATPTPALTPGVTPTPEAEGTPAPQEKNPATGEKTTPLPAVTPTPTPTPKAPGFEPIFAITVIFGLAYILRRKK